MSEYTGSAAQQADVNTDNNIDENSLEKRQQTSDQQNYQKAKKSASAFRTISEVADILDVQQHVLRFWETKFTQVKPLKRGGGRRYYRPEDIDVLQHIHHLLYTEGYTIKGVQKLLRGHGKSQVANGEFKREQALQNNHQDNSQEKPLEAEVANEPVVPTNEEDARALSNRQKAILSSMLGELKELREMVRQVSTHNEEQGETPNVEDQDVESEENE